MFLKFPEADDASEPADEETAMPATVTARRQQRGCFVWLLALAPGGCTAGGCDGWDSALGPRGRPDQRQSVRAGDLVLLPAGASHGYGADRRDPWTLYWVHFRGAGSGSFIERLGFQRGRVVQHAGASPALEASFDSLLTVRSTGYDLLAYVDAANHLYRGRTDGRTTGRVAQ